MFTHYSVCVLKAPLSSLWPPDNFWNPLNYPGCNVEEPCLGHQTEAILTLKREEHGRQNKTKNNPRDRGKSNFSHKGTVHPKMKLQSLSTPPHSDAVFHFAAHKTFCGAANTVLQWSSRNVLWTTKLNLNFHWHEGKKIMTDLKCIFIRMHIMTVLMSFNMLLYSMLLSMRTKENK